MNRGPVSTQGHFIHCYLQFNTIGAKIRDIKCNTYIFVWTLYDEDMVTLYYWNPECTMYQENLVIAMLADLWRRRQELWIWKSYFNERQHIRSVYALVRQEQAITCYNIDPDLRSHMALIGYKGLINTRKYQELWFDNTRKCVIIIL